MIKVSVIIPVYKVEKYLRQCVDSVIAQTLRDIEIILVDDESPDNCPAICDEYAKQDKRIKVIHQKNKGLGGARNSGMEIAKGDYILFVDSDDWIERNCLEILFKYAENNQADVTVYNVSLCYPDKIVQKEYWPISSARSVPMTEVAKYFLIPSCWAVNKLYRKDFLDDNQIRFLPQITYEDVPFFTTVMLCAKQVFYCPDYFYNYRLGREDSITASKSDKQLDIIKVAEIVEKILQDYNADEQKFQNFRVWRKYNYIWMYRHLPKHSRRRAVSYILKLPEDDRHFVLNQLNLERKWLFLFDFLPLCAFRHKKRKIKVLLFGFIPLLTIKHS